MTALDAVDISLAPGEIHALVGENGAGKSTLIKLLCGSYIPDAGEMQFCGLPYTPQSPLDALKADIRVVYQEFNLLPLHRQARAEFKGRVGEASRFAPFREREARRIAYIQVTGWPGEPHCC